MENLDKRRYTTEPTYDTEPQLSIEEVETLLHHLDAAWAILQDARKAEHNA